MLLVDDKDKEGKELWTSMFVLVLEEHLLEEDLLLRKRKQFRENKQVFFCEMTLQTLKTCTQSQKHSTLSENNLFTICLSFKVLRFLLRHP